jgi:hypothetical protein
LELRQPLLEEAPLGVDNLRVPDSKISDRPPRPGTPSAMRTAPVARSSAALIRGRVIAACMRNTRDAYVVSQTKPTRMWIAARKLTWSVTDPFRSTNCGS